MATTVKPTEAAALSPERQSLSDAIERLRQHDAATSELRENDSIRSAYVWRCMGAVDAAEDELRKATPRPVSRVTQDLRGHRYEPDPEPPEALKEAVWTAKQRLIEAEAQRDGIRAELKDAEEGRKRLHDAIDRAAWAVEAKHAVDIGLAAEVDRLQRAAYDAGQKLMLLYRASMIETKRKGRYADETLPIMQTLHRIAAYEPFAENLGDLNGAQSWADVHDRLLSDPTAEIP
jgi:hypothetical protein